MSGLLVVNLFVAVVLWLSLRSVEQVGWTDLLASESL